MRTPRPRDAAITGVGLTTPLGTDASSTWGALAAGTTAVRVVEPPAAPGGTRLAARVATPRLYAAVPPEIEGQAKFLNAAGEMAAQAADEAARAARLSEGPAPARRGLFVAQVDDAGWGSADFRPAVLEATGGLQKPLEAPALNEASLRAVRPTYLLERLNNNAFSFLAAWHGLRGANTSLSGWSGQGLAATALAARAVARGDCDVALAVGAARLTSALSRFEASRMERESSGCAAPPVGEATADACRPFDRRRSGPAPGEGAGALVLETLEGAHARGATPLAVVLGHGASTLAPAGNGWAPPAEGLVLAARAALAEAGATLHDLLGVVAPGTGSVAGDRAVLEALREVLRGTDVPVASVRGATGSFGPGGDVAEVGLAVSALREGVLPGTAGFADPEPGFEGLRVSAGPARGRGAAVLVLSAGIDGQCFAVLLARP